MQGTSGDGKAKDTRLLYVGGIVLGGSTIIGSIWACCWFLHLSSFWAYLPLVVTFGLLGAAGWLLLTINLECLADYNSRKRFK